MNTKFFEVARRTLAGDMTLGLTVPAIDMVLFSIKAGEVVKTAIDVDARMQTALPRGMRLSVGASNHRMARNLRDLGLDGAKPIFVQTTATFQSRLNAGVPVG